MPEPQLPNDQPQLQIVQPPPPTEQGVRILPIVRDVAIVWILTAIGGFVAGLATAGTQEDPRRALLAMVVSNFLLGTVAFTIAGCLAPPNRWRHLAFVALGAWLTSLVNVVFFDVTIVQWATGLIFMSFIMGIGGSLSYIFKRDTK
ncbi:MAG TPA: hypothetical protein VFB63_04665 [Bryobacteraceae bacterium]|nr:hypothetical protein [Bryobacteraceae bacterium]